MMLSCLALTLSVVSMISFGFQDKPSLTIAMGFLSIANILILMNTTRKD